MAHPTPDVLALIALGEDVDAEVLEHVAACRACFAEIEALQQVVTVGRSLGPEDRLVAPHPRVWQRIASGVEGGRVIALPGAVGLLEPPADPSPAPAHTRLAEAGGSTAPTKLAGRRGSVTRRQRWSTAALAAAVALVVGLGGGFVLKGALSSGDDVVGSTQLNALPQWAGANGTASVENGAGGQRTLVVSVELPPTTPAKGTLEVWMSDTRAQDMVPMGPMSGTTGRFPIPATMDLASHPIVDVSLEPVGDTDPAHSDDSVVRGRLKV